MRARGIKVRPRPFRPASGTRRQAGVTLMELLVAISVSAVALGATWPWLWNAGDAARGVDARAQAATSAAFAARSIVADLETATALLDPPVGASPERCLRLRHRHPDQAEETILVVWDPARRVLWRKATGMYLADNVESFMITYFDHQGVPLGPGELESPDWPSTVARVRVTLGVSTPAGSSSATRDVVLRAR